MKSYIILACLFFFSITLVAQFEVTCPTFSHFYPDSESSPEFNGSPTYVNAVYQVSISFEDVVDNRNPDGERHIQRDWTIIHGEDTIVCIQSVSSKHIFLDDVICPDTTSIILDYFGDPIRNYVGPKIMHNDSLYDLYSFGNVKVTGYESVSDESNTHRYFYKDWYIEDRSGGDSDHGPNHPSTFCFESMKQVFPTPFQIDMFFENLEEFDLDNFPIVEVDAGGYDYHFCTPHDRTADISICFEDIDFDQIIEISAYSPEKVLQKVSTLDLLLVQRHVLHLKKFDTLDKLIGADVTRNQIIDARDIIKIRKIIQKKDLSFKYGHSIVFREVNEDKPSMILNHDHFRYRYKAKDYLTKRVVFRGVKLGNIK